MGQHSCDTVPFELFNKSAKVNKTFSYVILFKICLPLRTSAGMSLLNGVFSRITAWPTEARQANSRSFILLNKNIAIIIYIKKIIFSHKPTVPDRGGGGIKRVDL